MKSHFLIFSVMMFCAFNVFAQTPYDNFAPEQSVKPMLELPNVQFKVENIDPNSEIRFALFDKNTFSLNLLNANGSIIKTLTLDPKDKKFLTRDPLEEKYYWNSPYVYCNNNPVMFIDPDGREVRVAQEYREQFRNDLQNVYGDKASQFSFNENGTLQLDGKAKNFTKGMSKDQKETFKGLNKAMSDKQVTSVVYANNYDITVGNETKYVDVVQEYGGGLYSKTDNLIVVAPNVGSVDVNLTLEDWRATGQPTQNVQQNTTSTLFHEIGERNTKNENYRGGVIDFENYARQIIGLPKRPYDLYHKKK